MDLVFEFLKENINAAIGLLVGGFFKWLWDKYNPREKAEVATTEIDNGSAVVKMYKDALDDLPVRFKEDLQAQEDRWQKKIEVLEEKFANLEHLAQEKERVLREEISLLKRERDLWKKRYNDLFKEHNKYKKEHP